VNIQGIIGEPTPSDDEIRAGILFKLHRRGNWGASHTAFDDLGKGWNISDLGKQGIKRVEKLAKGLIRMGWVAPKPTSYGLQVSLNPRQSETIMAFLEEILS
jgi:hypothetical protein